MSSLENNKTFFAPHLAIKILRPAMEFYQKAFGATVIRAIDNPDGSVHVAEMEIDGCIFHLHEESARNQQLSPDALGSTSVLIGLFTPDPDVLLQLGVEAGGTITSPIQSYDYGYRQAVLTDPFGHQWLLQKKI